MNDYISKGFGIIPSLEEKLRLEKEHNLKTITFLEGLTVGIACDDEVASKIICNGVLLLLDSKEELIQSMTEIKRISKKMQ